MTLHSCKKAGLTIEAALALPVFMMGLLTLVSALLMLLTGMRIQASLHNKAQELAMILADGANISLTDIRNDFADSLSDEDLRLIENGYDGIDMTDSDVDDGEYIDLRVSCYLKPLCDVFGLIRIPYSKRCLVHVWCGYGRSYNSGGEYVYITDNSEVYHLNRDCSHIRLTVNETTAGEVGSLRNDNGSRYRPCEICHARLSDGKLYITPDGDRYHNKITCSGLKRTVRAIRIEEIGERRPCSRCGR